MEAGKRVPRIKSRTDGFFVGPRQAIGSKRGEGENYLRAKVSRS